MVSEMLTPTRLLTPSGKISRILSPAEYLPPGRSFVSVLKLFSVFVSNVLITRDEKPIVTSQISFLSPVPDIANPSTIRSSVTVKSNRSVSPTSCWAASL